MPNEYELLQKKLSTRVSEGGVAPTSIVWMPKGTHTISALVNGEQGERTVHVTEDIVALLQASLEEKQSKNTRPIGFFDHQKGRASYIPLYFSWDEDKGIILYLDWTKSGRESIEGKDYSYHSPCFSLSKEGKIVGIPDGIEVGSLVNEPAFEEIERIAASKNLAIKSAIEKEKEEVQTNKDSNEQSQTKTKNMIEKLVQLGILTEEEAKAENATEIALQRIAKLKEGKVEIDAAKKEVDEAKTEVENLKCANQKAQTEIENLKASKQKALEDIAKTAVAEAIQAGKIAPKDEETQAFWTKSITENVSAAKQLAKLAPLVDTSQTTGGTPPANSLTGRARFEHQVGK